MHRHDVVLSEHRLETRTFCGAKSLPVAGPLRELTCSLPAGHEGVHKDTLCCWRIREFEDWQVATRVPRVCDWCSCGQMWPCKTIKAVQQKVDQERKSLMAKSTSLMDAATQVSMKAGHKVRKFRRGNAEHGRAYLGHKQKPWRKK